MTAFKLVLSLTFILLFILDIIAGLQKNFENSQLFCRIFRCGYFTIIRFRLCPLDRLGSCDPNGPFVSHTWVQCIFTYNIMQRVCSENASIEIMFRYKNKNKQLQKVPYQDQTMELFSEDETRAWSQGLFVCFYGCSLFLCYFEGIYFCFLQYQKLN